MTGGEASVRKGMERSRLGKPALSQNEDARPGDPALLWQVRAQAEKAPYPAMAPLNQYLMPEEDSEIALARSAAPRSISDGAEVLVLGRDGYTTAVKGRNGFVCLVERSWAAATNAPDFWNPKVITPICVSPPAARTYLPTVLMKAKLVLAGRSKTEIAQAVTSALDRKELPALEPGAMCYMMSKQQVTGETAIYQPQVFESALSQERVFSSGLISSQARHRSVG